MTTDTWICDACHKVVEENSEMMKKSVSIKYDLFSMEDVIKLVQKIAKISEEKAREEVETHHKAERIRFYQCGWTSFVEYKVKNKNSILILERIEKIIARLRNDIPRTFPALGCLEVAIINQVGPILDALFKEKK